MMKRIAVLIGNKGTGSNLDYILRAIDKGLVKNGKVVVVLSNKKDAKGLSIARRRHIPVEVKDFSEFLYRGQTRADYDKALGKLLKDKYQADLVVLAGWLLILSGHFIKYFPMSTINLHPGLLPEGNYKFIRLPNGKRIRAIRGMHTESAVQFALDQEYPYSGCTVHFITEKVDCGPVIARGVVKILKGDSVEALYKRIKAVEHKILPAAIADFCSDRLEVRNGKVNIKHPEI